MYNTIKITIANITQVIICKTADLVFFNKNSEIIYNDDANTESPGKTFMRFHQELYMESVFLHCI